MSTHLNHEQKAALQSALTAQRAALATQQRDHLAGQTRAEHAHEVLLQDGDDAPQRDAEREVDLALSDREVVALADIEQALARLASGHYGLCGNCGNPIPLARLQLQPSASRCVACAALLERGAVRPASP